MELEGRATPPMANGEVIFDAPWQSRAFGMARSLCEQGLYEWDEFRECLIDEIDTWEGAHGPGDAYHYYDRFLAALTKLLAMKGICNPAELEARQAEYAARPHGHDHVVR